MAETKVEQRHIDGGIRGCGFGCPVAMAIKEQHGIYTSVNSQYITVLGFHFFCLSTPPIVSEFVERFDQGLPVEPFKFPLDLQNVTKWVSNWQ